MTIVVIPGQRYKHLKTGGQYIVLALAKIEKTLEDAVVYFGSSGTWVRPMSEFADGRFELVSGGEERFPMFIDKDINIDYDYQSVDLEVSGPHGFSNFTFDSSDARRIAAGMLTAADHADKMSFPN